MIPRPMIRVNIRFLINWMQVILTRDGDQLIMQQIEV